MSVVTNHQLFSHTYLAQLQADSSHDEAAAPIAQGLRDWMPFRDASSLPSLIDSWVGPVLDFLEFHHAPVDDAPHVRLLYARRGDETPAGLCYVVPSGQDGSAGSPRSLDDTTKGHHPMAQAVLALRARALRWGMLTDGARWRLVDAQSLRRYEHYLEIDLDELTRSDDPAPLRLFYAFFHRNAFIPSPSQGEGRVGVGLDLLVAASAQATKAAEDHLKARVSHNEGILAQLCLGLVRADGRARYTEPERDAIYRDATYLLYRMLFILHAEARGLLPMDSPAYRAVSLTELVQAAHAYKLRGMPDPQAMTLWERLKRLCIAIYESDDALSIPAYNGGLFDDGDKPYLRDGHIADAYLTQALFDLAYMPATRQSPIASRHSPIDYRDLSVRHLGSLYEGMIEYRLQIAEETLWARRDKKGNVRFLRTGQDSAPRKTDVEIEPGQVYFSQSPGERRATGTYYTPEYIVDYIVRQTVVRGLEERRASLEAKLAGWLEEIATSQTSEVSETSEVSRMQRTADEELLRFVEEQVLAFHVCDPAMGSGHFLVNAAHQIANFLVETLHLTPWENDGVDADPVTWRRRVVERCLYGVDLSLMAVELAKLSLWLASVAGDKPLSFLGHHLRQGNSLIGARLEDLAKALAGVVSTKPSRKERKAREAGQLSMLEHPAFRQHITAATDLLGQISARVAETVEDVKAQESNYDRVRAELEPYRMLTDLWTARHFGIDVEKQQLRAVSAYLIGGAVSPVPEYQNLLSQVQELVDRKHFFNWELEFPQVFVGERSQSLEKGTGFNAVVGNPPWVLVEPDESLQSYIRGAYVTSQGKLDLYRTFVQRAIDLTGAGGRHGFVIPNTMLTIPAARPLREYIVEKTTLELIAELPPGAFEDVSANVVIYIVHRSPMKLSHNVTVYHLAEDKQRAIPIDLWLGTYELQFDLGMNPRLHEIVKKMESVSVPLAKHYEYVLGLQVYHNTVHTKAEMRQRVFHAPHKVSEEHLPEIGGSNLVRYGVRWSNYEWVRVTERCYSCPDGRFFNNARILIREIPGSKSLVASFCDETCYSNKSTIIVREQAVSQQPTLYYLLAVLNSRALYGYFLAVAPKSNQALFPRLSLTQTRRLPIPGVAFTTSETERQCHAREGQQLYEQYLARENRVHVLELMARNQSADRSDIVHDLLDHLARQMVHLIKERQRLEREAGLFRFVARDTPCLPLDKALGGPLGAGEMVGDPSVIRHDIEGLRLSQEEDGRWLLEVRAKLRDPESGWREHQRDRDGKFIRQWLPVYRLPLDEATGRFYHYAFAHLRGFDGAGKFPGGYTRTTLEKLKATKVPKFVPVDLAPLAALEAELAEVRRKIRLTDDLIDQIVYKLYGLTEEEIAIVEGRA